MPKYKVKKIDDNTSRLVRIVTNADRIRSMTDEELADALEAIGCPQDDALFPCAYPDGRDIELCKKCWLDWLKQEASE